MLDHLQSTNPPYVELLVLKEGQTYDRVIPPPPRFIIKVLHGATCQTKQALLSEFARALEFPPYFGENWDAFEECLRDLHWLRAEGYLLIITEAELLLRHDRADYRTLISILKNAGNEWARPQAGASPHPAVPFHVILAVAETQKSKRPDWDIPKIRNER